MTENNTDETLLHFMELIEAIDNVVLVGSAIQHMTLDEIDQDNWSTIQRAQVLNCELLETFKRSLAVGSKLADNAAVMSHMTTVIEAD